MRPIPLDALDGDVFLVIHHAVKLVVQDVIALSKPGGRTVSMTGTIGPTEPGSHEIYNVLVVPYMNGRPWTTSSPIDDKAMTFEVCNLDLNAPYPVAQEAKQRLAEIAAAMHIELGMPLNRWNICSHQEVYARGWDSYATLCPGADLQGSLDWIVQQAQLIVAGVGGVVSAPAPMMQRRTLMTVPEYVNIDGHRVKAHEVDKFFDGKTGRRVTDEEWDESERRSRADNRLLVPERYRPEG